MKKENWFFYKRGWNEGLWPHFLKLTYSQIKKKLMRQLEPEILNQMMIRNLTDEKKVENLSHFQSFVTIYPNNDVKFSFVHKELPIYAY